MTETMSKLHVATGGTRATTVQTVGLAGGLTTIIMWVGSYFFPEFWQTAPPGAEAAITTVVASLAGLIFRHRG